MHGSDLHACVFYAWWLGVVGEWEAKVRSANSEGVPNSGYHLHIRTSLQHGS